MTIQLYARSIICISIMLFKDISKAFFNVAQLKEEIKWWEGGMRVFVLFWVEPISRGKLSKRPSDLKLWTGRVLPPIMCFGPLEKYVHYPPVDVFVTLLKMSYLFLPFLSPFSISHPYCFVPIHCSSSFVFRQKKLPILKYAHCVNALPEQNENSPLSPVLTHTPSISLTHFITCRAFQFASPITWILWAACWKAMESHSICSPYVPARFMII